MQKRLGTLRKRGKSSTLRNMGSHDVGHTNTQLEQLGKEGTGLIPNVVIQDHKGGLHRHNACSRLVQDMWLPKMLESAQDGPCHTVHSGRYKLKFNRLR